MNKETREYFEENPHLLDSLVSAVKQEYVVSKRKLLLDVKQYIEEAERQIDGEWGRSRNIDQLIADNAMPLVYDEILKALEEG